MSFTLKDSGYVSVPVARRWEEGLRMKCDGTIYVPAGADVAGAGSVFDAPPDNTRATLALYNKPGTQQMIANGAIAVGNPVYAAADGKVSALPVAAGTYIRIGEAFTATAEDGDALEVAPIGTGIEVTVVA